MQAVGWVVYFLLSTPQTYLLPVSNPFFGVDVTAVSTRKDDFFHYLSSFVAVFQIEPKIRLLWIYATQELDRAIQGERVCVGWKPELEKFGRMKYQ